MLLFEWPGYLMVASPPGSCATVSCHRALSSLALLPLRHLPRVFHHPNFCCCKFVSALIYIIIKFVTSEFVTSSVSYSLSKILILHFLACFCRRFWEALRKTAVSIISNTGTLLFVHVACHYSPDCRRMFVNTNNNSPNCACLFFCLSIDVQCLCRNDKYRSVSENAHSCIYMNWIIH